MTTRLAPPLVMVLILGGLIHGSAHAQIRVDVGPLVAIYAPLGSFQSEQVHSSSLPGSPGDLWGLALGGHVTVWPAQRFGVQLQAASAWSKPFAGGFTPGGYVPSQSAEVVTVSAEVLYNLVSPRQKNRLWLGVGPGLVEHKGAGYTAIGVSAPSQMATVAEVGAAISEGRNLDLNLGVTMFFYNIMVSAFGNTLEQGTQVDPLFHVGLSWAPR
jgi:hypothetical protein